MIVAFRELYPKHSRNTTAMTEELKTRIKVKALLEANKQCAHLFVKLYLKKMKIYPQKVNGLIKMKKSLILWGS